MGIFKRKTVEEQQAELQAKLDKAASRMEKEQKHTDRERAQYDKSTMKHKIALAKRGIDAQAAEGIVWTTEDSDWLYLATMPEAVVIYRIAPAAMLTKLKSTDTIPYGSINSVQFDSGTFKNVITLVTSGETYKFETIEHGRFTVDTINARRN